MIGCCGACAVSSSKQDGEFQTLALESVQGLASIGEQRRDLTNMAVISSDQWYFIPALIFKNGAGGGQIFAVQRMQIGAACGLRENS